MAIYAGTLTMLVVAIIVGGGPVAPASDIVFWIAVIAAANLTEISTLKELGLDASLGSVCVVAAALLFPPSSVALFALIGLVYWRELHGQAPVVMSLFNRSQMALAGALASMTVQLVSSVSGDDSWRIIPAALAAVVVFEVANSFFIATSLVVRRRSSWREAALEGANPFPRFALNAGVSSMLSLLIALLVRDVGRWAVVLVVIPMWLAHSAQRSARQAEDRAEQLAARVRELEMLNDLSGRLLSLHDPTSVKDIADGALGRTVDGEGVSATIALAGADDGAAGRRRVAIPGADDAAIVIGGDPDDGSTAVFEAAAALIGLTLTRLEVEAELAENERARTALTSRILEEATHERSRIAMAVHDDVLPLFAAAQMQIDNIDVLLDMDQRDKARAAVEQSLDGVGSGITALRETLEELRQSTLTPGELVPAVERLQGDLQMRTGVRTSVAAPDPMPQLPFAVELLAYETVRGCLANVEKHAGATTVQVGFSCDGGMLVVLMQDDGRGFDPTAIGRRSHGLALMRQRAELARGSFDISGAPGAGTTVRLEVPTW